MIGAIAAGNAAIIKPSEMSPASEKVLNELLPKYLDQRVYRVAIGDYKVNQALLSLRWDKIFFTGSTRVGKIVLQAAAENLTPVSLELGGKSPTIVDESVTDLELVAQRIVWGKNVNAGQTCIAPDYVYCHEKHFDAFLALLKRKSEEFYGKDAQKSPDFGRIVSAGHFQRLKAMLDDSKDKVHCGGRVDENDRFIEPTVLVSPSPTSKIMTEEIFGPLLPVFKFRRLEEVIEVINEGEKPLTMYIFARDRAPVEKLIAAVSSGSVVVNDCLFQFANVYAPFGGVGFSGMGNYRGRYSFECFSTKRSVLRRDDHRILDVPVRYPPYTDFGLKFFKFAAYNLPDVPAFDRRLLIKAVVVLGVIVAFILVSPSLFLGIPPSNYSLPLPPSLRLIEITDLSRQLSLAVCNDNSGL